MPSNITVTTLSAFDPPGYPIVDDKLTKEQRTIWSNTISDWMTLEIEAKFRDSKGKLHPVPHRTPLSQFFNGSLTAFDTTQTPVPITWIGFPNIVKLNTATDQQRWAKADSTRNVQDEYLEWTVKKDQDDRIIYATFTCEGPEYWQFLGDIAPNTVLSLYKSLNPEFASQIKLEDLLDAQGHYNPLNKWNGVTSNNNGQTLKTVNPGCIMHLAQQNNTLNAEVDIAAQGTVIRKDPQGKIITDPVKLCNCSQYGVATRNSDPTIGAHINSLARHGTSVSIANPVAIYMHGFETGNFMLDADGTGTNLQAVPANTFTWVRGDVSKAMGLRLHVQIPDGAMGTGDNEGRQLTVSDLVDTSNGQNILFGAQFADYITMGVSGVGIAGGQPAPAQPCVGQGPTDGGNTQFLALAAGEPAKQQRHVLVGERSIPFQTRGQH